MTRTLLLAGACAGLALAAAPAAALAQDATASAPANPGGGLYGFGVTGSSQTPWAGPYIGVHGGYGWDHDSGITTSGQAAGNVANVTNLARPPFLLQDRDGYVAGGQVGWNVQRGPLVLGLEADASATDLGGKSTYLSPYAFGAAPAGTRSDYASRTDYVGTVRGRVGIARGPVMVYGTGGWAYGQVRDQVAFADGTGASAFAADHSYTPTGWAAGGGVEYALPVGFMGHGATLRAEYLHYDLGDKTINVGATGGVGGYDARFEHAGDIVRGGVNFKF